MIAELCYLGHPTLRNVAAIVSEFDTAALHDLATTMTHIMQQHHGVGLAAPQIGIGQRVIIFSVPATRTENGEDWPLQILLNPTFTPLSEAQEAGIEGCLSLPGLRGTVPRYYHIGYCGYDIRGNKIEREAKGFHARVVQHEIDHLDGIMYVDRLSQSSNLFYEIVPTVSPAIQEHHHGQSAAQTGS
jgi:peptide deformylase